MLRAVYRVVASMRTLVAPLFELLRVPMLGCGNAVMHACTDAGLCMTREQPS